MDYYVNRKNTLGLSADGYSNPGNTYTGNAESKIYSNSLLDSLIMNEYDCPSSSKNIHSNLYYKYTFNEKSALKADFDYLYNHFDEKGNYTGITYDGTPNSLNNWYLYNPSQAETQVLAFRADYYSPIGKSGQIAAGLKSSLVSIDYQGNPILPFITHRQIFLYWDNRRKKNNFKPHHPFPPNSFCFKILNWNFPAMPKVPK
jgi:hypothetical protein